MKKRDRESQLKRRKGTNKKERVEEEEEEERREEREKEGRERDRQRQRHRDRQRASITLCHIKWEDIIRAHNDKKQTTTTKISLILTLRSVAVARRGGFRGLGRRVGDGSNPIGLLVGSPGPFTGPRPLQAEHESRYPSLLLV